MSRLVPRTLTDDPPTLHSSFVPLGTPPHRRLRSLPLVVRSGRRETACSFVAPCRFPPTGIATRTSQLPCHRRMTLAGHPIRPVCDAKDARSGAPRHPAKSCDALRVHRTGRFAPGQPSAVGFLPKSVAAIVAANKSLSLRCITRIMHQRGLTRLIRPCFMLLFIALSAGYGVRRIDGITARSSHAYRRCSYAPLILRSAWHASAPPAPLSPAGRSLRSAGNGLLLRRSMPFPADWHRRSYLAASMPPTDDIGRTSYPACLRR